MDALKDDDVDGVDGSCLSRVTTRTLTPASATPISWCRSAPRRGAVGT